MTKRTCKIYNAKLKAKIALELIAEKKSIIEIAAEYNMPKSTILEWKKNYYLSKLNGFGTSTSSPSLSMIFFAIAFFVPIASMVMI